MRTSQNFDFICESISILPFLFISSLPTLSSLFCMELWLANFLGKGKIYSSKSSRWTATLAVDFSSKCYLFCECNVVRISQNIQNEISLDTFCDVIAYKFINLNWKLNGLRKENMHDHASFHIYGVIMAKAVVEGLRPSKSQC